MPYMVTDDKLLKLFHTELFKLGLKQLESLDKKKSGLGRVEPLCI